MSEPRLCGGCAHTRKDKIPPGKFAWWELFCFVKGKTLSIAEQMELAKYCKAYSREKTEEIAQAQKFYWGEYIIKIEVRV